MDPWTAQSSVTEIGESEYQQKFEDDFNHLTDYLIRRSMSILDNKFKKLKKQEKEKGSGAVSIYEAGESCMLRLTTEDSEANYLDCPVDRSFILKKLVPETQALTTKELVELLNKRKIIPADNLPRNLLSSQKVFCVVTGASRGIGRTISVELARRLPSGSVCLLLARSASGLADTKNLAEAANPKISIICIPVDLTQPKEEDIRSMIIDGLDDRNPADFDQIILIHNVGSVGDVSERAASMGSLSKWQEYFALNVFSVAVLNSELLKLFNSDVVKNRLVVNITSKCGLVAFKSMGYYCCGKAAREMYFQVLAIEEEGSITVLNYSPGPVETDMFHEIIENVADNDQRKVFSEMKEKNTVLTCEQTVGKLFNLLEKGNYKSGDHVDYFD